MVQDWTGPKIVSNRLGPDWTEAFRSSPRSFPFLFSVFGPVRVWTGWTGSWTEPSWNGFFFISNFANFLIPSAGLESLTACSLLLLLFSLPFFSSVAFSFASAAHLLDLGSHSLLPIFLARLLLTFFYFQSSLGFGSRFVWCSRSLSLCVVSAVECCANPVLPFCINIYCLLIFSQCLFIW